MHFNNTEINKKNKHLNDVIIYSSYVILNAYDNIYYGEMWLFLSKLIMQTEN